MHADELDLDAELVRRLLASQFPKWSDLPLERIRFEGTDNAIFRLGDELSVRLPKHAPSVPSLVRELEWLPTLERGVPFAVPQVVGVGEPAEDYPLPWAVVSWLAGETAESVPGEDLAELLAALRRIGTAGAPRCYRGGPLRDGPHTRAALEALGDARALAAWEQAVTAPHWDGPDIWLHGDLDLRNLLVSGGRLAGVLDWGVAGIGEPAIDVAVGIKALPPSEWDGFRGALEVDDATWSRARGWIARQAANALTYYTEENNPALVRECRNWLDVL